MKLIAHSYLNRKAAFLNGAKVVHADSEQPNDFLKTYYRELTIDYPKFHKMDALSKSAFLTDYLLEPFHADLVDLENKLQLIFANSDSSKQTDLKYIDSYEVNNNPSPSLFVYTLPNILTGEISIKHKWYGENCFFIQPAFDAQFFTDQAQFSFLRGNDYCLCGWVEMNGSETEECFLFLLEKSDDTFEIEQLTTLLKSYRNE
jgi:hypothetical protein